MDAQPSGLSKCSTSFGVSLAVAAVVNGLLVVAKEKIPAVMSGMKHLTGHHWISHSAIVIALFFVLGFIFSRANAGQGMRLAANSLIRILATGVVLGAVIIIGFYLLGD